MDSWGLGEMRFEPIVDERRGQNGGRDVNGGEGRG